MKKIAILILAIMAMLVFATASFAATVTLTGELNLGYNLENGFQGPTTLSGYPTDTKIFVNVQATDQISGTVMFRDKNYGTTANGTSDPTAAYPYIDRAYLTMKTDFATFTAGRFVLNVKDNVDLLTGIFYNGDYKDGFALQAVFPVVDGLTAKLYVAAPKSSGLTFDTSSLYPILNTNDTTKGDYAVALTYTGSNFGGSVNLASIAQDGYYKWTNGWNVTSPNYALLQPIFAINAYIIPIDAFKLYVHYGSSQATSSTSGQTRSDNLQSNIFGVSYDNPNFPLYGRVEADFQKGVSNTGSNTPWGLRLGYRLGGGLSAEYDRVQYGCDVYDAGANNFPTNYVKFKFVF